LKEVDEHDDLIIGQIGLLLLYKHNSCVSSLDGGCLHFVLSASSIGISSHGLSKGIVENIEGLSEANHRNSTRGTTLPPLLRARP
jgi:hypothetical protein